MATQSRFDLNAAIETWRHELVTQPQITAEDRRELERHLADAVADLRQRGLNDEEAFWLARRRIGQPQQLADEFAKANPRNVWQERAFWMALALAVTYIFRTWTDFLMTWVNQNAWAECVFFISLAVPLVVLGGAMLVIRRKNILIENHYSFWKPACGLLIVLMATFLAAYFRARTLPGDNMMAVGYDVGLVMSWVGNAVWPAAMVLAVLVTQKRTRKLSKQP